MFVYHLVSTPSATAKIGLPPFGRQDVDRPRGRGSHRSCRARRCSTSPRDPDREDQLARAAGSASRTAWRRPRHRRGLGRDRAASAAGFERRAGASRPGPRRRQLPMPSASPTAIAPAVAASGERAATAEPARSDRRGRTVSQTWRCTMDGRPSRQRADAPWYRSAPLPTNLTKAYDDFVIIPSSYARRTRAPDRSRTSCDGNVNRASRRTAVTNAPAATVRADGWTAGLRQRGRQ